MDTATIARLASVPVACPTAAEVATWPDFPVPGTSLVIRLPFDYQAGGAPRPSPSTAGWSGPGGAFVLLEPAAGAGRGGNEIIIDPADDRTVFVYESVCGFVSPEAPLAARRFFFAPPAAARAPSPDGSRFRSIGAPAAFVGEAVLVAPGGGRAAGAVFARTQAERDRLLVALANIRVAN